MGRADRDRLLHEPKELAVFIHPNLFETFHPNIHTFHLQCAIDAHGQNFPRFIGKE